MESAEMFDGILMNIVQKAEGIEGFYDTVFSFMRRKTDFYMNPAKGKSVVNEAFDKNAQLFEEDKRRQDLIKQKQEEKRREEDARKKAQAEAKTAAETSDNKVEEITDEEAEKLLNPTSTNDEHKSNEPSSDSNEAPKKEGEGDDEEESGPPLVGNGITTDKYSFTQTLSDFTLNVFLPAGIKGKDLIVEFTSKSLKVQIKGQPPIIDGELPEKIKLEDTYWTIDTVDGKRVMQITFDKSDKMKWWDCAIVGDQKLNTKKIEPENSKLSDLDGDTRQTVEKMMFDQHQKQKGLPTSDEMEKRSKLEAFMKAHPEMDFSKAKFS